MDQPLELESLEGKIVRAAKRFSLAGLAELAVPEAQRLAAQNPDSGLTEQQILDAIIGSALKGQSSGTSA